MSTVNSALESAIAGAGGAISFADFMRIALYHPETGYYNRAKDRVGFGGSTDFFTATSTGSVFSELVVAACIERLGANDPGDFHFVEIGAEPGGGILPRDHPFKDGSFLRRGEPLRIPDKSIVVSNELFDAQPFHRLVFADQAWREIGVAWSHGPAETLLPEFSPPMRGEAHRLPKKAPEGYHLDLPVDATALLNEILSTTSWEGLFIAFDYGKSWRELIEATPQGTARAYRQHRQSNHLLADPGEQDLTCHICWDWLEETLLKNRFTNVTLQSQESFFVTRATDAISAIISARPGEFDPRRQTLQQLLHPGNMGQKFQVLHARR